MSKKLTLLALTAIAFGSASVCANIKGECMSKIRQGSKRAVTSAFLEKRCTCVAARHGSTNEKFEKANEHCKEHNDNPA